MTQHVLTKLGLAAHKRFGTEFWQNLPKTSQQQPSHRQHLSRPSTTARKSSIPHTHSIPVAALIVECASRLDDITSQPCSPFPHFDCTHDCCTHDCDPTALN